MSRDVVRADPDTAEARARRYLLDELCEADRESFELELLASPALVDATERAEEALMLDYAQDRLPAAERDRADRRFFDSGRRRELAMTRAILANGEHGSRRGHLEADRRQRRWFRADLAAAASLALIAGSAAGWLVSSRLGQDSGVVVREVAVSVERGQAGATELSLPPDAAWVRLVIALPAGTHTGRLVTLNLFADVGAQAAPLWTRDAMTAITLERPIVELDVPVRLLPPGTYFIRVTAKDPADGATLASAAFIVR